MFRCVARILIGALVGVAHLASAQGTDAYPTKPIRVIVPFGPGGASDFVARIMQAKLAKAIGQEIIIENRAGAAGNIGMELAAQSMPDGYTLFLGNVGTLAINPSVFGKVLRVEPLQAFAPISLVADTPDVLIANATFPPNSVKEFVAYAAARPGQLSYASPGSGSLNRLEMELLRSIAKLDMVHIPYKAGAGQAVTDIISGQVPVMFTTISSAVGHVRGGKLKALAVTTGERVAVLPDVPTMVESGFPEFVSSSWQGMLVPMTTPRAIVTKLHGAIVQALKDPEVAKRFDDAGVKVVASASPEDFGRFIAAETKRWSDVVQASGATAD